MSGAVPLGETMIPLAKRTRFRIFSRQHGIYVAALRFRRPWRWTTESSEARVFEEFRDLQHQILLYWQTVADTAGWDPDSVAIEEVTDADS